MLSAVCLQGSFDASVSHRTIRNSDAPFIYLLTKSKIIFANLFLLMFLILFFSPVFLMSVCVRNPVTSWASYSHILLLGSFILCWHVNLQCNNLAVVCTSGMSNRLIVV